MSSAIDEFMAWTPPAQPTPTDEQAAVVDLFGTGENFKVEAGAGTGKTTTLGMAGRSTKRRGQYLAFNRSIVDEAGRSMPGNVAARTAHSLAYAAVGNRYRHRLNAPRMRAREVAEILGLRGIGLRLETGYKHLEPWRLAGITQRAVTGFAQSADPEPAWHHMPYQEGLDLPGRLTHNRELAEQLVPAMAKAWADLMELDGRLPFRHEHYLKAWQLDSPRIGADFVLVDEAQDLNPVMRAIVDAQADHAQLGWIGDSQQQIYAWMGAQNALAAVAGDTAWLTQSFRFGPAIATVANRVLDAAGAPLTLVGLDSIESRVVRLGEESVRAVLCRTNARAVLEVMAALEDGRTPCMVGGGKEIIDFARGAAQLQDGRKTTHPELACFDTWAEVLDYVEDDAQGHELKLLVDLVRRFSAKRLMAVLLGLPTDEAAADVVISTAHKAKGREWDSARLTVDLTVEPDEETGELDVDELRLLYVAVTRARLALDVGDVVLP